jgi:Methyltransferase FkbM domain
MQDRSCDVAKAVVYSRSGVDVAFKLAGGLGGVADHIAPWNVTAAEAPAVHLSTVTLADVLAQRQAPAFIHYVSLDIEGAEYEALLGLPFDRHRVGAFTIEHNREEPKRSRIRTLLESRGYRHVHAWHQDDYYVAGDLPY